MTSPTPQSVVLAPIGTPLAVFQKERTDALREMFNNEDEYGIYPTTKLFVRLDKCVENLLATYGEQCRREERESWFRKIDQVRQIKISDNKRLTDGWDMALLNLKSMEEHSGAVVLTSDTDNTIEV